MIRSSPNPNHAHLIHWFEWGEDAFRAARDHNKPVMLFLSAFWCRYCQRMDEGAFSDSENIALLNAYFIAIRAENAQRPDVDTRYNLNGWPTVAFMTSEGKLLAAANYLSSEEFGNLLARVYAGYEKIKDGSYSGGKAAHGTFGDSTVRASEARPSGSSLMEITKLVMDLADRVHGGYGRGQKFIHPEANDFLLSRYEATKDSNYLAHVCLTLDRMRESAIHDHEAGGYFRTSSGRDWSHPHREKLLVEQAGLLANCLRTFRITKLSAYAEMAEGIIDYLDRSLSDASTGAFYGCEDFIRTDMEHEASPGEYFSILDDCVYTDANAQSIVAYLEAAAILGKSASKDRALKALDFLWGHCNRSEEGMFHCFDGKPHVPGLLVDQAHMGTALAAAHRATGDPKYLEQAQQLAEFVLTMLKNPQGGYYDLSPQASLCPVFPLILIEQNGAAASFFLALAEKTKEPRYRDSALWAVSAFPGDFNGYGIDAAGLGQALAGFRTFE